MPGNRTVMPDGFSRSATGPRLFHCFFLLLLLAAPVCSGAVVIQVAVDRNPVQVDESFQIVFSAQQSPDDDPDFTPLEKDFEVLNQSQSSSFTMENGSFSKTVKWTLTVMAKHAGVLTIPGITFGSDRSQPVSVVVNQQTSRAGVTTNGQDLFLQVEASPGNPYVQAQVIYTVRFYRRVDIAQASLSEPELQDAVIEKIGDDRTYNTQSGGENYVVTERKYAIFPQKSGPVRIPPITLTAEVVVDRQPRFNGFFRRRMTRSKRVVSQAIDLDVRGVPAEFTGQHWLPAEQLLLKQEWSGDIGKMQPGEPLTRTLVIVAQGATVGQLPELQQVDGVRSASGGELQSYPDQPMLKEQKKQQGIIALREEKVALIPSRAGTYRLPEIRVPWWNTKTNKMALATLPAVTLKALAVTPAEPQKAESGGADMHQESAASRGQPVPGKPLPLQDNIWFWVSAALALAWTGSLWYLLRRGKSGKRKPPVAMPDAGSNSAHVKLLQRACRNNNALAAKDALLQWGRSRFQEASLNGVARHCNNRMQQEIRLLNETVYGRRHSDWQGKNLWQAFQACRGTGKAESMPEEDELEPLYRL